VFVSSFEHGHRSCTHSVLFVMSIFFELVRKMGNRLGNKDHPPDKFLLPQTNVGHESGDVKVFRKLILRGRLAPFYPGFEDSDAAPGVRISAELEHC